MLCQADYPGGWFHKARFIFFLPNFLHIDRRIFDFVSPILLKFVWFSPFLRAECHACAIANAYILPCLLISYILLYSYILFILSKSICNELDRVSIISDNVDERQLISICNPNPVHLSSIPLPNPQITIVSGPAIETRHPQPHNDRKSP